MSRRNDKHTNTVKCGHTIYNSVRKRDWSALSILFSDAWSNLAAVVETICILLEIDPAC